MVDTKQWVRREPQGYLRSSAWSGARNSASTRFDRILRDYSIYMGVDPARRPPVLEGRRNRRHQGGRRAGSTAMWNSPVERVDAEVSSA